MTRSLVVAAMLGLMGCAASAPVANEPVAQAAPVHPPAQPTPAGQRVLATLMSFLPGTFDSIAQEKGPGTGTRMRIAPFWREREKAGEFWLYVEHARAGDEARPFRQRIYRFTESRGRIYGDVFALPGPAAGFAGEWRKPAPFAQYRAEQLREFAGCRLGGGQMETLFWMRTEGKACRAEHPAAAHEFSEMLVGPTGMKNGEQGYDAAGKLVAGEAGVWDFRRMSREPR